MKIILFVAVVCLIIFLGFFFWGSTVPKVAVEDAPPLVPRDASFEYYGWFAVDYAEKTPALERIRTYTNTGFAWFPQQAKVLQELKFEHIVYVFNPEETIAEIISNESLELDDVVVTGIVLPGVKNYAKDIPQYREKFFTTYKKRLAELRAQLTENGTLNSIDIFYLADEPALQRMKYPDQAFLDQIVMEFETVFPNKKTTMAFAENWDPEGNPYPGTDRHLMPPPLLDIVMVDPYIDAEKVSCNPDDIKKWLYNGAHGSRISWATQFNKPIIVVGDAQLRNNKALDVCYPKATFDILRNDTNISGLFWFAYDASYQEDILSGAANAPAYVHAIEELK